MRAPVRYEPDPDVVLEDDFSDSDEDYFEEERSSRSSRSSSPYSRPATDDESGAGDGALLSEDEEYVSVLGDSDSDSEDRDSDRDSGFDAEEEGEHRDDDMAVDDMAVDDDDDDDDDILDFDCLTDNASDASMSSSDDEESE